MKISIDGKETKFSAGQRVWPVIEPFLEPYNVYCSQPQYIQSVIAAAGDWGSHVSYDCSDGESAGRFEEYDLFATRAEQRAFVGQRRAEGIRIGAKVTPYRRSADRHNQEASGEEKS